MIYKRKIDDYLINWKNDVKGSKALLVEGARRIGKSTSVENFAKNNYKSYILIDFGNARESVKELFYNLLDNLDTFFMILSAEYNVTLYERDSIIIFDEVQLFPKAREAIKYLVKDGRYDYIETGSLISIKENTKNILIPSEERSVRMLPMDFEEFAWALGETQIIDYIRTCFNEKKPLYESLHKKATLLFNQYVLVGGMPKAVDTFLAQKKQFEECDKEKRDILTTYRNDILKLNSSYKNKVLSIFDQIPSFLSSHEKRVKISSINPNDKGINYEETFFWLADSMICNECFLCNDPNVGLSLNENRTFIKCYMGDTGLLVSHAFDENVKNDVNVYSSILNNKVSINKGMLFENVIAQMLVANNNKLYFYNQYNDEKHRNDIEIDFIISSGNKTKNRIIPIEVKSTKKYKTVSLNRFIEKYKSRIETSYIIHPKNLSVNEDGIICIPAYMTFCL